MRLADAVQPFSLLLLSLLLLTSPIAALAQTTDQSRAHLTVGQAWVQITLSPGAAAEGELRFTFEGPAPATASVSVNPVPLNPLGDQTEPNREVPGAASWITLNPAQLAMRPGVAESLRYRVEVPPGTPAGDHSALIAMETESPPQRVGTRLTVSVPGEVHQQAALQSFASQKDPPRLLFFDLPAGISLFDDGPIEYRGQIQNQGNVQFTASGRIRITDPLGSQVALFELPGDQVFPGETGTFVARWANPPAIGLFTAHLTMDAAGSQLAADERILMLPWQQVLAALFFAIALRLLLGRRLSLPLPGRRQKPVPAVEAATAAPDPAEAAGPESRPTTALPLAAQPPVAASATEVPLEAPVEPSRPTNGLAAPTSGASTPAGRPFPGGSANQLDVDDLLRWGQQAARAGDRLVAYRLFVQAVTIDPANEDAWLWRAGTAEQPEEAKHCLEQVIAINPDNVRARRGLEEIDRRFAHQGT